MTDETKFSTSRQHKNSTANFGRAFCLGMALAAGAIAPASAAPLDEVRTHLYAGETAAAADAAEARLVTAPSDDEARFALGTVQFLRALERLGQSFHRHGLASAGDLVMGLAGLPFVRIPVPANTNPEPLTYGMFQDILARFVSDLEEAEATLAGAEGTTVALPLNIGLIRLDLNGDGLGSEEEALWQIFRQVAGADWLNADTAALLLTDFDASDVLWLRAYCHLLMGIAELPLAHDWQAAFDATFHTLFPHAGLPGALLDENFADRGGIADLIAFVHLNHWPVVEPGRMTSALGHFEAMVSLSRENWRRILAETDVGKEWIPNPQQEGALPGMQITQAQIDAWLLFLDELENLLKGEKLLPHWRFDQGINVRRMFLEPTTFDIVLLIQGSAALPYLEDGALTTGDTWRRIITVFGGDFFRYAVWFN